MSRSYLRPLLVICLLGGGFSALVYEVTWMRMLSLSFGVSVYAASAVLTAFMAGLALGSWLFGRIVSRLAGRPGGLRALLHTYALLQVGAGLCALLAAPAFAALAGVYVWLYQQVEPGFYLFNLLRFGLASLALVVPTLLMGGTFPLVSQLLGQGSRERGRDLGLLYAANTFGGVLGACLAGLVLIRLLGSQATLFAAAVIDWVVAAVLLYAAQRAGAGGDAAQPVAPAPTHPGRTRRAARQRPVVQPGVQAIEPAGVPRARAIALWGFTLSGVAALGYEVVWTRLLAIFSLNAVFSFAIMLTTFLVGLAAGSAIMAQRVDRVRDPLKLFGTLQLAIGLCAVLVLYAFARLPSLLAMVPIDESLGSHMLAEFVAALLTMLGPTLLMGAVFPVAARIYAGNSAAVGASVGRLYALNTIGATIGAFLAGFVLIPLLGLQRALLVLALLNLVVGSVALLHLAHVPRLRLAGAVGAAVLAAALLPPGVYLGFREHTTPLLVFYKEGVDATVSVFEVRDPPLKISFVNGRSEVPTDPYSMRAFHLLGHLPALLHPEARSALMVSFGNGIATGAMSTHGISRIHAVELVAEQVEAARFYRSENRNVLEYPGLTITIEDGRNYLLRSDERFDIITADATHPINTSSWALFTREFYLLLKQRLTADGVVVQWLPFHDLSEADYRAIVRTFQSVFPHTTLWYTGGSHTFLVGTPEPLTRADVLALEQRMVSPDVQKDLGGVEQLAADFLMDEQAVAAYTAGAPIVSDDTAFFLPAREMDAILRGFAPYAQVGQAQP